MLKSITCAVGGDPGIPNTSFDFGVNLMAHLSSHTSKSPKSTDKKIQNTV